MLLYHIPIYRLFSAVVSNDCSWDIVKDSSFWTERTTLAPKKGECIL